MQGLQSSATYYYQRLLRFVGHSLRRIIFLIATFIFLFFPLLSTSQSVQQQPDQSSTQQQQSDQSSAQQQQQPDQSSAQTQQQPDQSSAQTQQQPDQSSAQTQQQPDQSSAQQQQQPDQSSVQQQQPQPDQSSVQQEQPVQPGYPRMTELPRPSPVLKHRNLKKRAMHHHKKAKLAVANESESSSSLLDRFYALQKTNRSAAENTLLVLLKKDPKNTTALSELGYMYIDDKKPNEALPLFISAYQITGDYQTAAQVGYLLDELGRKKEAYYYFEKATHSPDPKLRQASNEAMTNLAGLQTKVFNDPFFADIYTSPFYYSRFGLFDFPFQGRFGVALGKQKQWEFYVGARGAYDSKSQAGTTPQIYDDDAVILALGVRYHPFYTVPLYFYSEEGAGYDLINQNRPPWRNDFRAGAFYEKSWGAVPTYAENFRFTFKPAADVYADSTFYTRYNNNWITSVNFRPGFRVMEYKSSSVGIYLRAFGIVDTNHEFYNNLTEVGPGIIWIPNNRYDIDFRFEALHGFYFDVNSPDPNPYGSNYNNLVVMFELYQRF